MTLEMNDSCYQLKLNGQVKDYFNTKTAVETVLARADKIIGCDLSFRSLQGQIVAWAKSNFPDQRAYQPALGVGEEAGELGEAVMGLLMQTQLSVLVGRVLHAQLKFEQNIRGTREELESKLRDAVGDLFIFLINLCISRGFDAQQIVEETWAQVSKRNWRRNSVQGVTGS